MLRAAMVLWVHLLVNGAAMAADLLPLEPMPVSYGQRPRATTLEYCAANADLIAAGRVVGLSEPMSVKFRLPYAGGEATERRMIAGKLEIARVVADRHQVVPRGGEGGKTIISFLLDAPDPMESQRLNRFFLSLKPESDYVLLLQKSPEGNGYYLPARVNCALPFAGDGKAEFASLKTALNRDAWAWGKEVRSLQLALLATPISAAIGDTIDADHPPRLMLSLVLRNRSDQPIPLNLYPLDTALTIAGKSDDGESRTLTHDRVENLQLPGRGKNSNIVLQPGQILFLDRFGKTDGTSWSSLWDQKPGKWTLRAKLELREPSSRGGTILAGAWTGTLESAEVLEPQR